MSNQTEQKGGPFIFSTALNAATQPDSAVAVSETFVSRESSLDDLIHHATLQHRAVCWHKGLNADLLDSKHAPYLTVAVNETDVDHPDLNDSSPATPAGGLNVKWQVAAAQNSNDQTPVSAYVPFSSLSVVTAVSTDHVVITDTSDSANPKRALVSDIITAVAAAPLAAQYVTLATDATLTNERVLTAGTAIDITDAGPGLGVTIDVDLSELSTGTPSGADTFLFVDADDSVAKRGSAVDTLAALGGGVGNVVGPASAVADSLPMYDSTTGKLIKDGKVMMGTSAIGAGVTPDTQILKPVPAASHGVILSLEAQPAVGANTDGAGISLKAGAPTGAGLAGTGELFTAGAAVVVNIAQASVNTDVKGTLSSLANTATVAAVGTAVRLHGQDATTGPWEKVIPFELTTDGTTGLQTIIDIAEIANSTVTITYEANAIRSDAARHDSVAGWAAFSHNGALALIADTQPHNTASGSCDAIGWVASGTNMRLQVTPGTANVFRIRGFARVSHGTSGA